MDSSADFQDAADDVFIVEDEIVGKDASGDLRDWTSENDRVPSVMQRMQTFFRYLELSIPSNVQFVHSFMKDALAVFSCFGGDKNILEKYKVSSVVENVEFKSSLNALE